MCRFGIASQKYTYNWALDYNGDQFIDGDDVTEKILDGSNIKRGDANRDGSVNRLDLDIIGQSFGSGLDMSWIDGDFTGDGYVGFPDLDLYGLNQD